MSTKVVGKLDSWDEADLGGSDYMNLDEGSNRIRVITSPYQFYSHWAIDQAGVNRKVRCALDGCPLCQQGERAVARWVFGVINYKSNKPAIIEIGPQIYKQIHAFSKNPRWGDPRKYSMDIVRQPKGSQPLYIVTPEPKEAMTDEEKAMAKEFMARVDFSKLSAAASPEEVREKMGMSAKAQSKPVNNDFEDVSDDPVSEPPPTTSADDDDEFNFN
jgi:hypothetical protein